MTVTDTAPSVPPVPPGLKGVEVTTTTIGDVRGSEGFYHYRQYSAVELATKRSLEDVWRLMLDGELPATRAQSEQFSDEARQARTVPPEVLSDLTGLAGSAGPEGTGLGGLRTALSAFGTALRMRPLWDSSAEERRADLMRISAVTPVLAASLYRIGRGLEPLAPRDDLGHAANYIWMLTGEEPDPTAARALEQYLILTVDHGFNASTFTARVIASTGADAAAAVAGALSALSGPLHGGAPSRALDTLDAIGLVDLAEGYVRDLLARGERVMGFGHAVYRTEDPRSVLLKSVARSLGGPLAELAEEVEQVVLRVLAETKPERPLYTNVEYYAGVVMDRCGIPRSMFTPTFAVSRVIGWCANIAEQADERRLIRPSARYVGPPPPALVPGPAA